MTDDSKTSSSMSRKRKSRDEHESSESKSTSYEDVVRGTHHQKTHMPNRGKIVNWRLACFLAHEYLSHGYLFGKNVEQGFKNGNRGVSDGSECNYRESVLENPETSRRERERLYCTVMDFLRTEDVHIPGIVNPSQLIAWLGFT